MKKIILSVLFSTLMTMPVYAGSSETITFGGDGNEIYSVQVTDGRVVGGYAKGSASWTVYGGAYDGKNLQITLVRNDRHDCYQWWTHNYEVNGNRLTLRTSVDKCGKAITNRNVDYYRK